MRHLATALLLTCGLVTASAADVPKLTVKAEKTELPGDVNETIAAELDTNAVVFSDAESNAAITLWLRKALPAKATPDQVKNGLTYRELPDGTFVGVVKFAGAFTDFRKQEIPAGVYSLRFAVQPDTGDHMGTAPHPDFLLLTPIDQESSAEPIETKKLVERSAKINDGDHPAVMLLFPNFDKADGPKLAEKDGGVLVVQFRRPVEAEGEKTTLGFALVVHGHSKTR